MWIQSDAHRQHAWVRQAGVVGVRGGKSLALLGKLIRVCVHGWAQSSTDSACSADTPGTLHSSRSFVSGLIQISANEVALPKRVVFATPPHHESCAD